MIFEERRTSLWKIEAIFIIFILYCYSLDREDENVIAIEIGNDFYESAEIHSQSLCGEETVNNEFKVQ